MHTGSMNVRTDAGGAASVWSDSRGRGRADVGHVMKELGAASACESAPPFAVLSPLHVSHRSC